MKLMEDVLKKNYEIDDTWYHGGALKSIQQIAACKIDTSLGGGELVIPEKLHFDFLRRVLHVSLIETGSLVLMGSHQVAGGAEATHAV